MCKCTSYKNGVIMAEVVIMPKLGNTVESSIILSWHVNVGDTIKVGDILCEIETDKATLEVESTASGILLARFFEENDDVPVLENLAVIGKEGEDFHAFKPTDAPTAPSHLAQTQTSISEQNSTLETRQPTTSSTIGQDKIFISPRARGLATRKGIDYAMLDGTGPNGRIIERDIEAAIKDQVKISPLAQAMLDTGEYRIADTAEVGKRVTKQDLIPSQMADDRDVIKEIPLRGVRKTIAKRMLESMQSTAQLTLNSSADATALKAYRSRLKTSPETLGLQKISINDLIMYAVAHSLTQFPDMNALYENDTIYQYVPIHLGMAVDTPRGLIVPVIHNAGLLSLKQMSEETHRLANACVEGSVKPDELTGGTFTVTNLGGLGIESFTPVLNLPQVAILGVGSINLRPVEDGGNVVFRPYMNLSLTINHQVVDGAPAARFLAHLASTIANIDLLLAL